MTGASGTMSKMVGGCVCACVCVCLCVHASVMFVCGVCAPVMLVRRVCVRGVYVCKLCMCPRLWSIRNLPHSGCFAANCSAVCLSLFRRSLRAPMLCKGQQHRVRTVAPYQTHRRCAHQRYDCVNISSMLVTVAPYLRQCCTSLHLKYRTSNSV